MKLAIVHDYLAQHGGAERVVQSLHEIWPEAPIYTSVYDQEQMGSEFAAMDVRPSWLQNWCRSSKIHKAALPFYPMAFEQFDLSEYDVVLSTSSGFAKGVITPPETLHICYCHTPLRLAWRYHEYLSGTGFNPVARMLATMVVNRMRIWDASSAMRVDHFVANSRNTANRIRKYYRRDAEVVFPPVDASRFALAEADAEGYYLVVSRLVGYKRVDLAVEAFTRLGIPLRVVGSGPDLKRLKRMAGDNVTFLGRLGDNEVARQLEGCRGFVFPGEEDFGIAPLEAMACGRPVIAYGRGGALETVIDGVTGVFFPEQRSESIIRAVQRAEKIQFHPLGLRRHALRFDIPVFHRRMRDLVEQKWEEHKRNGYAPALEPMVAERALEEEKVSANSYVA